MATTPNRYVPDTGTLEVQQTAALRAVSSNLEVGDDDSWIDLSAYLKDFSPGSPAARASTSEYNASQKREMLSRSTVVPKHTPTAMIYDTNGTAAAMGVTNDLELREDIFKPALDNDIELPVRWSKIGTTGKPLHTYSECYVMRIELGGIKPGSTDSDVFTVSFEAEDVTESTVS